MAVPTESVHPTAWHLDARGRDDARRLAARLEVAPGIGCLVTSTEPKASETAAAIGDRWEAVPAADDRLREAGRPWIGPGYRAVAHRYLRGELPEEWEAHGDVEARMAVAVNEAVAIADGQPVVVVSHGLALAVHLGRRLGPGFDRQSFWSGLAFPDAWVLDASGMLHRSSASAESP